MQALERTYTSNNWLTVTYLFLLLLLLLLKILDSKKLLGYVSAFLLKGFIIKKAEERQSFFNGFNLVMYIFFTLVYGLFFFYSYNYFNQNSIVNFSTFLWLISLLSMYFTLFLIIDFSLIRLFNIQNIVARLVEAKLGYLYNTALLLFPFLVMHTYGSFNIYLLFGVFLILFLLSRILIFTNNKNLIISKFLYFILYLCALEIAPLLIIFKIIV